MKPLDMADTYPPSDDCYLNDDEPTVKIQVPEFVPQVVIPMEEHPSYALVLCIGFGAAAIFLPAYYIGLYWLLK